MPEVRLQCPEGLAEELKTSEKDLPRTISIAAAVKFYEVGWLSRSDAATFAGMPPDEFMLAATRLQPKRESAPDEQPQGGGEEEFDIEALRRLSGM